MGAGCARRVGAFIALLACAVCSRQALAQEIVVDVPRLSDVPRLASIDPERSAQAATDLGMAHVTGFVQRVPRDGQPITEPTDVFVGHDGQHFFTLFEARYRDPSLVRAHLVRREDNEADDWVNLVLDTFNDERRGYIFGSNAYGVQWDALWTEGQGYDKSVDFLFSTEARRTSDGFLVLFTIPFASLRFPARAEQRWRLMLGRGIQAADEGSFWPAYSSRIDGRLNQAGIIRLSGITRRGRGIAVIPTVTSRGDRLRQEDRWSPTSGSIEAGVDMKAVLHDRIVLDATVNPDFGQVESDEPQVTVNQRFELFYPEKRPFFLENANYFQTPINLVFTRRMANPAAGFRLTTKADSYAIGSMLVMDQATPGRPDTLFAVGRVSRDVGVQSSLGAGHSLRHDNVPQRRAWGRCPLEVQQSVDGPGTGHRERHTERSDSRSWLGVATGSQPRGSTAYLPRDRSRSEPRICNRGRLRPARRRHRVHAAIRLSVPT
jgi:Domain of unknown function (DUF5916)